MDNFWYLFGGLTLAWGAVFFYLGSLARRARDLKQQIEVVQAQLDRNEDG